VNTKEIISVLIPSVVKIQGVKTKVKTKFAGMALVQLGTTVIKSKIISSIWYSHYSGYISTAKTAEQK